MITYENIIAAFERFATAHYQIKGFSHGEIDTENLGKSDDYPILHVVPQGFNIDSAYTRDVQVFIFDKPRDKDEFSKMDYQRAVLSDCELIMNDLVNDILNGGNAFQFAELWSVVVPMTGEYFVQSYHHVVSGVQATMSITVANEFNACLIPITPVTPPSPTPCEAVEIDINGVLLATIPAGGTLDITVEYENGTDVGVLSGGNTVTIPNPGVCAEADVRNSTSTYDVTVASGGVLVLPDTTYNVYVDSVLEDTIIVASIEATTININWI